MRYVIEVYRSPGGVYGSVVTESGEETAGARPFHGWLELLALLEPPPEPQGAGLAVSPPAEDLP
ncbi:hypothetical protein [Streptomyces sp. NPDC059009]|uniref:hypothetical protein n=1 Tax=Streptomyces sp. NPDC059009 TaxID=3346694 RepID=UPI0036CEFF9A